MIGPADVMYKEVRDDEKRVVGVIRGIIQNGHGEFDEVRIENMEKIIFVPIKMLKIEHECIILKNNKV